MFNHKPCKEICCFPNSAELTSLPHWHARYTCQLWSPIFLKVPGLYSLWKRLFSNNTIAWFTIFIFPPEPFLLNVTGYGEQGKLHRNTLGACSERILTRTGSGFFVIRSSASFEASTDVQRGSGALSGEGQQFSFPAELPYLSLREVNRRCRSAAPLKMQHIWQLFSRFLPTTSKLLGY